MTKVAHISRLPVPERLPAERPAVEQSPHARRELPLGRGRPPRGGEASEVRELRDDAARRLGRRFGFAAGGRAVLPESRRDREHDECIHEVDERRLDRGTGREQTTDGGIGDGESAR